MTCAHVLGLIDAGSFAGYSAAHLDAAWEHARQCATCGPALHAATAIATDLASLPQPEPPAHLATAVMARIARLETPDPSRAAEQARDARISVRGRGQDLTAACAALAAGCLIALSIALGEGPALDLTSPRIGGTTGLLGMQAGSASWVMLAVSLVVYLIALFAPLRAAERRRQFARASRQTARALTPQARNCLR